MEQEGRASAGSLAIETLSLTTLEQALETTRRRREDAQRRIEELRREMTLAQEEERLLTSLITVRGGRPSTAPEESVPDGQPAWTDGSPSSHAVVDEVLSILSRDRRPAHISEIMRTLRERQIRLPGAGTQANVISHLARDRRISRPSRGMYALAEWGIAAEEPRLAPARRRRTKKVTTRRKTS